MSGRGHHLTEHPPPTLELSVLSIGDFARYLGVSVRMLRHYDALGLLVPAPVDPASGYRSYSAAQLDRANRLIALKDPGFALDQIAPVLDAELSVAELRAMLTLRRAQVAEQIAADQVRSTEIERRLRTIEGEAMTEHEFVEKPLPAVRIAQLVAEVADQGEIATTIGPMFERLAGALAAAGVAPDQAALAWYRPDGQRMEVAAAFPTGLAETTPRLAEAGIEVATLPAADRAITVLHHGGFETIGATWQDLARQVEERGYRAAGAAREVYLHMPMDGDPSTWVTELQQPVG